MVKLSFKLGRYRQMMDYYRQLLSYTKSAVTRNYGEKSITAILDYISTAEQPELLQEFYAVTLDALNEAKNERLWFRTNLKLGKLYHDQGDFRRLASIIRQLHASCQHSDGTDDMRKGTQLLEVYALEIQMYTAQRNSKKLKALYEQSLRIKSAIPHPLIMAVIRECGGKMHLVRAPPPRSRHTLTARLRARRARATGRRHTRTFSRPSRTTTKAARRAAFSA